MKTRALGAAVLLGSASLARAQMLAFRTTGSMLHELQQMSLLPTLDNGNPLQPTGWGTESVQPGTSGKIPEPEADDKSFQIIRAGTSKQVGNDVSMSGGVEFMYQGYHVFADSAEGSLATHIFTLKGEAKLIGKDALVTGDQISVDFDQKIYHAIDMTADLKPSLLQGVFIRDAYTHGQQSYGSATENETLYGGITTCDLLHPHYEIDGDRITVRPGKRAIFRKARLKLFGRTVLKLDYLSIPLDDRTYNNLPEVGESEQEGYFIKTRYGIPLSGNNDLFTRLDYMSLLGVGIGADWMYKNRVMNGTLEVYTIEGPGDMLKISDQHNQKVSWGTLNLATDYENNNYLVNPGSTIQSEKATLTIPQGNGAVTRITLGENGSSQGTLSSLNENVNVNDTRKFGQNVTTLLDVNYQNSTTSYQGEAGTVNSSQENLNVKADITDDLTRATAELEYQRQIPIGSTQALYGTSDETPEMELKSDSKRLLGSKAPPQWPFKLSLSIGEFSDETGNGQIARDSLDMKFEHKDISKKPFHSDVSGEFRQGFFSDGTAQYVLNFADTESYQVGNNQSINFHYNYLRPYGYSPLAVDQTGQQNLATADFSVKPFKTFSIGAQSGFDLLQLQQSEPAWQPVGIRTEWQPKDYFLLRTQEMYDTLDHTWDNVRIDLSYKPGATFLSVGSYYDGLQHTWENVNIFLDNLTWGKTKFSAILTWDGFTQQFDTEQYSVIYDLHCAEAVFTYAVQNTGFDPGRTITFMIRLKALPFSSPFGAGTRGQPLGTGTGASF